jgi:hypothetical protein
MVMSLTKVAVVMELNDADTTALPLASGAPPSKWLRPDTTVDRMHRVMAAHSVLGSSGE